MSFWPKLRLDLGNFKADAENSFRLFLLQAKMALESGKLEGGKATAEKSIGHSYIGWILTLFFEILALPTTDSAAWARRYQRISARSFPRQSLGPGCMHPPGSGSRVLARAVPACGFLSSSTGLGANAEGSKAAVRKGPRYRTLSNRAAQRRTKPECY